MSLVDTTGQPLSKPKKIMVSIPAGDMLHTGFAYDLVRLVAFMAHPKSGVQLNLSIGRATVIPRGRQELVKKAQEWGADYILWLDSDMRFPKETLIRLMAHNEPIVGTVYSSRRWPYVPTAAYEDDSLLYLQPGMTGLAKAGRIGFGCVLTDMSVFAKLAKPWFHIGYSPSQDEFMGEDVFFSNRATEAGYEVLVDIDLSRDIIHLGETDYGNDAPLAYIEDAKAQGFKTE